MFLLHPQQKYLQRLLKPMCRNSLGRVYYSGSHFPVFSIPVPRRMCASEEIPRDERSYKDFYKNIDIDACLKVFLPEEMLDSKSRHAEKGKKRLARSDVAIEDQLETKDLDKVEYDMDSFDLDFLHLSKMPEMENAVFETVIDRLEKEWFGFLKTLLLEKGRAQQKQAPLCDICTKGQATAENRTISCEGCGMSVHQECYGVPNIQGDFWCCRKCVYVGKEDPECEFCTRHGGAYKQTDNNRWGHVLCVLYIEKLSFLNHIFLEPIDSSGASEASHEGTCSVCNSETGILIKCSFYECQAAYHVTCGIESGFHYDHSNLFSYCSVHDPTAKTSFWSIEDFYGFNSLSYKTMSKKPEVRKKAKLHIPSASFIMELRGMVPFCSKDVCNRISEVDLVSFDLNRKEEVLNAVCKYWCSKRKLLGRPLLKDLDILTSDVEILPWLGRREEKFREPV